jgi:hypothetical protein
MREWQQRVQTESQKTQIRWCPKRRNVVCDIPPADRDPGVRIFHAEAVGDDSGVAERDCALAALHSSPEREKRVYARAIWKRV